MDFRSSKDFWQIVAYLAENWPEKVLENFDTALNLKVQLLKKQPHIGFKSKKYSKYRKTIVARYYILIYSVKKEHIVIHRLKHASLG